MKKKITLFLVLFLFIFGPVVRSPLGVLGDLSLLAIVFYFAWCILIGRPLSGSLVPFLFLGFSLSALAIFNLILVNGTIDSNSLQAILRPVKGLIVFIGIFFAVRYISIPCIKKFGPRKTYEILLFVIYAAVVVHGVIIILQFFYPSFRDLTYAVLKDMGVLDYNKQFRMPGLAGAGGAQISAVQGLGFLIGVHLAIIKGRFFPFLIMNLLLVASFVLTGRTGFVLVGISALYWLTSVFFMKNIFHTKLTWLNGKFTIGLIVFIVVSAIWIVPFLSSSYEDITMFRVAVDRTFQTYSNYVETNELSDNTLKALSEMIVFPENIVVFLFGDAQLYSDFLRGSGSDIGYIRIWWGYGLIGLLGHMLFYLLMGYQITRLQVRKIMGIKNITFGLYFLGAIFVLNYKEPFFFSRISYPMSLVAIMGLSWLTQSSSILLRSKVVG